MCKRMVYLFITYVDICSNELAYYIYIYVYVCIRNGKLVDDQQKCM